MYVFFKTFLCCWYILVKFFLLFSLSFSRQMGKIRTCTAFFTKGRAGAHKLASQVVMAWFRLISVILYPIRSNCANKTLISY